MYASELYFAFLHGCGTSGSPRRQAQADIQTCACTDSCASQAFPPSTTKSCGHYSVNSHAVYTLYFSYWLVSYSVDGFCVSLKDYIYKTSLQPARSCSLHSRYVIFLWGQKVAIEIYKTGSLDCDVTVVRPTSHELCHRRLSNLHVCSH